MIERHRYFIVNKPLNMVSQFISSDKVSLLGDLDFDFPEGTHAIGRLDSNSEGLLILTTNKKVTRLLFSSEQPHGRLYLVQVNHKLSTESLRKLQTGVSITIRGGAEYIAACDATIVEDPGHFYIGANTLPGFGEHTWLLIGLNEGKYHQVRKMIAAIRHRCKRLIRISIEDLKLEGLKAGKVKEIDEKVFFEKLKIEYKKSPPEGRLII